MGYFEPASFFKCWARPWAMRFLVSAFAVVPMRSVFIMLPCSFFGGKPERIMRSVAWTQKDWVIGCVKSYPFARDEISINSP